MKYTLLLSTIIFISGCAMIGIRNSEEAAHKVLFEEDNIQIRQYEKVLVAQTQTTGNYKQSSNEAFKRLAGYIFGENKPKEKIAMTTPVIEKQQSEKIAMTVPVYQQKKDELWTMTFVLPAKFTLETIPEPLDRNVDIMELPSKKVAVITYSGLRSDAVFSTKTAELMSFIKNNEYVAVSDPSSAAYDPPWTIPFLRRNEVHIEIE